MWGRAAGRHSPILDPNKALLHGFMQDKDRFIDRCTKPITNLERMNSRFIPTLNKVDYFKRNCKVWFFKFGYEAMFENMMLTKHQQENCHIKDSVSRLLPASTRDGVFDMAVFPEAKNVGTVICTDKIAFSTLASARRDLLDPNKALLHGFMQDKDRFIDRCTKPITNLERMNSRFIPTLNKVDYFKRNCKVWFFKFGYEAMFENMMLTKHQQENKKKVA